MTIDKSKWSAGPWMNEPDHVAFEHEGVPCIIHRNGLGAWCGYVAVPPGHPWHGLGMHDVPAQVHGGITYADACQGDICHVAKPGEPDDVWWIGFDCSHHGDLSPAYGPLDGWLSRNVVYRDQLYVTGMTKRLAEQTILV